MRAALRLSSTAAATRSAASLRMYHGMAIPQRTFLLLFILSPTPFLAFYVRYIRKALWVQFLTSFLLLLPYFSFPYSFSHYDGED